MKRVLFSQTNACLMANNQGKRTEKATKTVAVIMPSAPIYPVFFEIEGDGGEFRINPDDRDPDEMTDEAFRRRYLGW